MTKNNNPNPTITLMELIAEPISKLPSEDDAYRASLTRLGDGQTNPDE